MNLTLMKTTTKTLSSAILCLISTCLTAHAGTVIADFAADFSAASNPSGLWSYGSLTTLGGAPTLSTNLTTYGPGLEVKAWSPAGTPWPTVGLNTSTSSVSFGAANSVVAGPGQGLLHPGATGAFADVRYTAAGSLVADLSTTFSGISNIGTTTDVHVLLNGASLFSADINTFGRIATYTSTIHLAPGDVLDFAVGWGSNNNFNDDSTGFFATLTSADTPEPGAFALALLGFAALAARRVRK